MKSHCQPLSSSSFPQLLNMILVGSAPDLDAEDERHISERSPNRQGPDALLAATTQDGGV